MKYSLQHKILLSLSVVAFVGLSALLFAAYNISEQNVSNIVNSDMIEARKSLDIYLNQYFLINNADLDESSLESEAESIAKELSSQVGSSVAIYDTKGIDLSSPDNGNIISDEDYDHALQGKTAYTVYNKGARVIVNLSYPINSENNTLGILRYSKDYSQLYETNRRFETIINVFAVLIFIFIYVTSFVISGQIAKPVRMLTKSTEQITDGDFNLDLRIDSSDEIGELADRFKKMTMRIKDQINIIEKDRDALKEAQAQSKTFFDNVTHELKTPLTTILGYAQVMKENGFNDREFFEKGTSYIIRETQRLNCMVVEILELSRTTSIDFSYRFEKLNLSDILRETCEEMRMKAKRYNIEISDNASEELYIKGDREKIKEILINLIDNSIKYGKVKSKVEVSAYRKSDSIELHVRDKGDGIPEEHLNRVFQPFYRVSKNVSREKGSAGLGLSIVKNIVESHGGSIEINSRIDEGTEVVITFRGGVDA
jgi:signal transduction histidine kinase